MQIVLFSTHVYPLSNHPIKICNISITSESSLMPSFSHFPATHIKTLHFKFLIELFLLCIPCCYSSYSPSVKIRLGFPYNSRTFLSHKWALRSLANKLPNQM